LGSNFACPIALELVVPVLKVQSTPLISINDEMLASVPQRERHDITSDPTTTDFRLNRTDPPRQKQQCGILAVILAIFVAGSSLH
jgi:hypothetical protein